MAKAPITVKGWSNLVENAVEAGLSGLRRFVSQSKEDRVTSDYTFSATQELVGQYAVGADGKVGVVLRTLELPTPSSPLGGDASLGYDWTNEGDGAVKVTVTVTLSARDERVAELLRADLEERAARARR